MVKTPVEVAKTSITSLKLELPNFRRKLVIRRRTQQEPTHLTVSSSSYVWIKISIPSIFLKQIMGGLNLFERVIHSMHSKILGEKIMLFPFVNLNMNHLNLLKKIKDINLK